MSKKQPKIKRYSSRMGKGAKKQSFIKKAFVFLLAPLVLFGAGYFVAPFIFDSIGDAWQNFKQNQTQAPTPSPTATTGDEAPAAPSPVPTPSAPVYQTIVYCEVLPNELLTAQAISEKALQLKAKGVTTAVITLKNSAGNILFNSETEIGKAAKGNVTIDLPLVAETFKASGITSCANLYTFMDKTTPIIDRSTGVKYIDTDYTWLDSAKELGGKAWANPASTTMHDYMYSITEEILSAGFKEIIYSAIQLPTGHSLDKRDFGATDNQLLAQIKGFINTLQTKVTAYGARASFAFDFASASGGDYKKYLEMPTRLGAENIILTCQLSELEEVDLPALINRLKTGDSIDKLSIWISDFNLETVPEELSGYFVK